MNAKSTTTNAAKAAKRARNRRRRLRRNRAQANQSVSPRVRVRNRTRRAKRGLGKTLAQQAVGTRPSTAPGVVGGRRNMGVVHPIDEQVALVNGSVSFNATTFAINPGNASMFPLFSRIAQNYERYEFLDLQFVYNPSQNLFSTQGTAGFVDMSITNDAKQAPPSSQAIAEVLLHPGPAQTAEHLVLNVPRGFLDPVKGLKKYVRPNGLIPGGSDPHEYDAGQLFFWTLSQANTNTIGELKVRGRCRVFNQVLETSTTPPINFNSAWFQSTSAQTYINNTATTSLNATATFNNLTITNVSGVFTPPVGNYMVFHSVKSNDSANEVSSSQSDFQKNSVSVYQNAIDIPGASTSGAINLNTESSGVVMVSANGTDTFKQVVTLVGAAGTLTGGSTVYWLAI